jgi:hypothetical protein
MHGSNKELEGLQANLELLIDKKNRLAQALIIAYDEEKKFALQRQVQELETEIQKTRTQISALEQSKPGHLSSGATTSIVSSGKKIFFSYSQHDRPYLDQLLRHMASLRRLEKVAPWTDSDILPGEEWDDAIKSTLAQADIILLLVSSDFLATDYIWKVEITTAMERHEKGEARVIPIFIRSCDWSGMPFGKLNGLPSKAKPVSSYVDKDQAWVEVIEGIKRVL